MGYSRDGRIRKSYIEKYQDDSGAVDWNRRELNRVRRGKAVIPAGQTRQQRALHLKGEIQTYKKNARGNLAEAIKRGASKAHMKARSDLRLSAQQQKTQRRTAAIKAAGKPPAVQPAAAATNASAPVVHYKSRPKAPAVNSRKKANSRPPSVKAKVRSAAEDKKRYKALTANRAKQSEQNYLDKTAGKDYKAGQKKYNSQTKEIKKSRYSWASHKAAMARRGKKASQASYAKFKRYNGI